MKIRSVIRNIGWKSILAFVLVFLLVFAATSAGGMLVYRSIKRGILNQGAINALQAAKEFDRYLLVRKNVVTLAGSAVDGMLQNGMTAKEILAYLVAESESIQNSIDPDITGLYGWIRGEYCDGANWVPDESYVPTERPWYTETIADDSEITFVKPYLDQQSMTTMMTMSRTLWDGTSVLALDIGLNQIQEITEQIASQTPDSYGVVLDKTGQVIAHSDQAELGNNYLEETGTLGSALAKKILLEEKKQFELQFEGEQYVVYAENIEGGWHCVSLVNTEVFYRPLRLILFSLLFLTVLEAVVFIAVFYRLSAKNLAISVQNVQIGAVADMYVSIYDIDLSADTIQVIRRKEKGGQETEKIQHEVQKTLNSLVESRVDEMSKPVMLPFVDITTLIDRLERSEAVTEEFLNAQRKWCRSRFVAAERDQDCRVVRVLLMVESIDEEKRRRDNLKTLSETDQMTGLNNRAAGERKIRALVNGGTGGMFVMLDIDKFKNVNDRFGHDAGDQVIIAVAKAMIAAFRNTDILMRLGGDEFVAYAPGVLTEETGSLIIQRLFAGIAAAEIKELGDNQVFVSVGGAFCQNDEILPFGELYKRADSCAYESKKTQGNAVTFYRK